MDNSKYFLVFLIKHNILDKKFFYLNLVFFLLSKIKDVDLVKRGSCVVKSNKKT